MFSITYFAKEEGKGIVDDISSFHATKRTEKLP